MNDTVRNGFCGGSSIYGATLADAKEGRKNIRSFTGKLWETFACPYQEIFSICQR